MCTIFEEYAENDSTLIEVILQITFAFFFLIANLLVENITKYKIILNSSCLLLFCLNYIFNLVCSICSPACKCKECFWVSCEEATKNVSPDILLIIKSEII